MVTSSSASWYTSLVDHTFWPFVVILSLIFTLIQLQLCLTYSDQVERCKPQSFSTILIDKNKNLSWRNKEWTRQSAETFVRLNVLLAWFVSDIPASDTPYIRRYECAKFPPRLRHFSIFIALFAPTRPYVEQDRTPCWVDIRRAF